MEPNKNQYHFVLFKPNFIFWSLASALLFLYLGSREIWTQEWRWGEIVRWMSLHHDFFHPTLAGQLYFDKPLLSYWLMLITSKMAGQLSPWTIRLPSAISGLISIACLYQIGASWQNRKSAGIAAMMLTTTYYFLFWARTASSDMLNLAGILCAVAWYFSKRDQPGIINYSIFFLILALTALLKGLVAIAVALLVIAPDFLKLSCQRKLASSLTPFEKKERTKQEKISWMPARTGMTQHIWKLVVALLPAIFVYFLPFWLTSLETHTSIAYNGLHEVYRENILRFFDPFDHKDPIYSYFIYLPIYLLPWTLFFLGALYELPKRWAHLTLPVKQLAMVNVCLFLFFTLSGSRRSYYILPLVPFAILLTAEWITLSTTRIKLASYTAMISLLGLFSWFILFQPLYYSDGGLPKFSQQLTQLTTQQENKKIWQVAFLDADNRLSFYLPQYEITFLKNNKIDLNNLFKQYDILITQETEVKKIKNLRGHRILFAEPHRGNRWFAQNVLDAPVAIFSQ